MNRNSNVLLFYLGLGLSLLLLFACQKEDFRFEVPPIGTPEGLIGKWVEKESDEVIVTSGTTHIFEFTENQFFLELSYWSDGYSIDDHCLKNQTIYFRGSSPEILADSIKFYGEATDENYRFTMTDCVYFKTFDATFNYKFVDENTLLLNPDTDEVIYQIRLERQ